MANFNFLKRFQLPAPASTAVTKAEQRAIMEAEERAALIAEGKLPATSEVLGVGTSRANPKTIPIEDADVLSPRLNEVDLPLTPDQQKLNKYKAYLAATGAGGAGMLAVNLANPTGEPPPPMAAEVPAPIAPQAKIAPQIEDPMDAPTEQEKVARRMLANLSRPSEAEIIRPAAKDINFGDQDSIASVEGLKDAQQRSREGVLGTNMARIGAAFSTGASGIKNNFDPMIADQIKSAESIPQQYQEQVKFEKEDPNSPMSRGYRDLAKSMGFNIQGQASAADLERLMPQLANIYNQQEAQHSRALTAKENREARRDELQMRLAMMAQAKKEQKDLKLEDKKNKFIADAQKVTSKEFEKLKKVENAFDAIEQAQNDKMGAADVSILYNFIKSQDPESVVREGEIALGQRGMSLGGRLRTMTLGQLSGELLDPQFRKDVLKISRRLRDQGYNSYDQSVQTIRDTAQKRYGMTEDELTLIDPDLNRKKKKKEAEDKAATAQPGKTVIKKGYNASTNQTQLIYSDGTKEIVDGRR